MLFLRQKIVSERQTVKFFSIACTWYDCESPVFSMSCIDSQICRQRTIQLRDGTATGLKANRQVGALT